MLFNEPKLLKFRNSDWARAARLSFSALQRAEIAEMPRIRSESSATYCFSALQRAEIAEMNMCGRTILMKIDGFSALQRAEIAEITRSLRLEVRYL